MRASLFNRVDARSTCNFIFITRSSIEIINTGFVGYKKKWSRRKSLTSKENLIDYFANFNLSFFNLIVCFDLC